MTRRERLEAKLEKREEWADKAQAKADARFETTRTLADAIPLGQPILVGHHSEGRARRDAERIRNGMNKAVELTNLAAHHEAKASGIAAQLERSVFSDDTNAIEALEARIAERERECAHRKTVNAAFRKLGEGQKLEKLAQLAAANVVTPAEALEISRFWGLCHWEENPYPAYANTNARANIRRDRERIEEIKRRTVKAEAAAAAPNGVSITRHGPQNWCVVTFAEKPAREVLDALRAAGYRWGGGSWQGALEALPALVSDLEKA